VSQSSAISARYQPVAGRAGGGGVGGGGASAHSQQSSPVSHPLLSSLGQPVESRKFAQLLLPHTSPVWQSLSLSQSPSPRRRFVQPLTAPLHNGGAGGGDGGGGDGGGDGGGGDGGGDGGCGGGDGGGGDGGGDGGNGGGGVIGASPGGWSGGAFGGVEGGRAAWSVRRSTAFIGVRPATESSSEEHDSVVWSSHADVSQSQSYEWPVRSASNCITLPVATTTRSSAAICDAQSKKVQS